MIVVFKYFENCNLKKIDGRNCAKPETCQAYKLFQSYPAEVLDCGDLGIASRLEELSEEEQ